MTDEPLFKKGNLVFLSTLAMDFLYVVSCQQGQTVTARKLDSPMSTPVETLPIDKVVKLADEQERLLPVDVMGAISKQREIVFAQPKKSTKKEKKVSLEKAMKKLSKESYEEILSLLMAAGIEEEGNDDNDEEGDDNQ